MSWGPMTTRQPLISFVVVTHDRPIELVESRIIRSIAEQNYPRCELVLVGEECAHLDLLTKRIGRDFSGLKIRSTNLQRPPGLISPWALVAKCRNRGIELARGALVSCQDDDNELAPDFAASLLDCLLSARAEAAWCFRRMVMPDGSPYPGTFFPWAKRGSARERLIYEIWRSAGVLKEGCDIARDELLATHNSEIFSTVDANEWLVRAEIYRQFPFREKFGVHDLMTNTSFDDIWNQDVRIAGLSAACSRTASLIYHLGGGGSLEFIEAWEGSQKEDK